MYRNASLFILNLWIMETTQRKKIAIQALINAPVEKVWKCWTDPQHIIKWNSASEDWHTPSAANDLRVGGRFTSRMEAKDGSMGFDFGGTYNNVRENEWIGYTMDDGRQVNIHFYSNGNQTRVEETFEAEETNSIEMQKGGWQAILDNFKNYVEQLS